MASEEKAIEIEKASLLMRQDIVRMTYKMGNTGAHIGGGMSLVEIMAVLYLHTMKYDINHMNDEMRDRLILSKGHGTLALYAAMKQAGIIDSEDLESFKQNESQLSAHPAINEDLGIEFSSGSLGQGLSLGVGMCLGLKRKNNDSSRVFVILGDGECDEGSVWEAAQSAAHFECSNLVAIVDNNKLQYDGNTESVMALSCIADKWKSFGWNTIEIDGHDTKSIIAGFDAIKNGPTVIIADTVKGKGVSFMENDPSWHNHSLSQEQYVKAMLELGVEVSND